MIMWHEKWEEKRNIKIPISLYSFAAALIYKGSFLH